MNPPGPPSSTLPLTRSQPRAKPSGPTPAVGLKRSRSPTKSAAADAAVRSTGQCEHLLQTFEAMSLIRTLRYPSAVEIKAKHGEDIEEDDVILTLK